MAKLDRGMYRLKASLSGYLLLAFFVTAAPVFGSSEDTGNGILPDPEKCSVGQSRESELAQVQALPSDLFEIRLKNGMSFQLSPTSPMGDDSLAGLEDGVREKFFRRRKEFLTHFVRFLNYPRLMGAMSWSRKKVEGCFKKSELSPIEDLVQIHLGAEMREKGQLQRMGYETIAKMVQILDVEIWKDSSTFINAKSRTTTFIFGLSAGAAVPFFGVYGMKGIQLDFGYDFETKESFFQRNWLKQNLKNAVLCFEALIAAGVLQQYQVDRDLEEETTTTVAMPFGFAYRNNENTVSFGYLSGLSLADVTGVGLISLGFVAEGTAILSVGKGASLFSLYSTDTKRTTIPPSPAWKIFSEKLNRLIGKKKGCEDHLDSKD